MSILLSIIAFFIIFSLLILIHEGGHFLMAKRAGVKVEEFGFGLPPKIFGKKYGETIYSINAIPFGGFVRLYGEDIADKKALKSDRSFIGKSVRDRVLIVCGGVMMNFLLAYFLIFVGFVIGMKPLIVSENDVLSAISSGQIELELASQLSLFDQTQSKDTVMISNLYVILKSNEENVFSLKNNDIIWKIDDKAIFGISDFYDAIKTKSPSTLTVKRLTNGVYKDEVIELKLPIKVGIQEVDNNGIAAESGFQAGYYLTALNGQTIFDVKDVLEFNLKNKGQDVSYSVENLDGNAEVINLKVPEDGKIGIVLSPNYDLSLYNFSLQEKVVGYHVKNIKDIKLSPLQASKESVIEIKRLSKATFIGITGFFKKILSEGDVPQEVSGPVGIAQMVYASASEGFNSLIRLTALLSLSLAVLNILPIPALDGGRLLFIIIEVIRGKRADAKLEAVAHQIGYFLLLLLILMVTYNDILRLFK